MANPLNKTQTKFLKAFANFISENKEELDSLAADKRDHYDNKSDKWREGENGEAFNEVLEKLETLQQAVEEADTAFQELPLWNDA